MPRRACASGAGPVGPPEHGRLVPAGSPASAAHTARMKLQRDEVENDHREDEDNESYYQSSVSDDECPDCQQNPQFPPLLWHASQGGTGPVNAAMPFIPRRLI
jgi:hypothetical protein